MITQFDFNLLSSVSILESVITEALKILIGEGKIKNKQVFALIVSIVCGIIALVCKAVLVEVPVLNLEYFVNCGIFILFTAIMSQISYDKLVKVILQLIVKK